MALINAEKILKNIHILQEMAFIVSSNIIRCSLCMMPGHIGECVTVCRATAVIDTVTTVAVHIVAVIARM